MNLLSRCSYSTRELFTLNGLGAWIPALCLYPKRSDYPCRYGDLVFLFCKTDSHSDANDLRSVAPSAFKIQSQFALPFSKETLILGRKHPKLAAGPGVLIRRWQIAFTDVVDVGATVSSLKSLRSRHVTKSNGVVGPVILLLTRYQFCRR